MGSGNGVHPRQPVGFYSLFRGGGDANKRGMFPRPNLLALVAALTLAASACASEPEGLAIASFGASTKQVTEDSAVQITAIVSDPDGAMDTQAGTLIDVMSGGTYGPFVATSTPGTFTISVDWPQFNDMLPIDAAPVDGTTRELRADFFDMAGTAVHASATVKLRCASDLEFARGGSCDPWFHTECGAGWCGVTNYTDHIRTGDQLCAAAVHSSTCTTCSVGVGDDVGCATPLAVLARCECHD